MEGDRLFKALASYSEKDPTYALVYGGNQERPCAWFIGPEGVIAAQGIVPRPSAAVQQIWTGLEVNARSRASRSPRTSSGDCPPYEPTPYEAASPEFLALARAALSSAARDILPTSITAALLQIEGERNRLLIVPSGNLRKVPFAALPIGESTLIDRFIPVIVPSVGKLGEPQEPVAHSNGKHLIVGNPDLTDDATTCWTDLPDAEREARAVAEVVGAGTLLTGRAATHSEVLAQLRDQNTFSLIYFATHGVTDPVNPADGSFLALAGEHLRGADLRQMSFKGDPLVVMSACQTGLGKEFEGGVFGLPEAWHHAGAKRIVMSLWDVNDTGTAELMSSFVKQLEAQQWRGAEFALAAAMREMRRRDPDPMIWSAFTYFGVPER